MLGWPGGGVIMIGSVRGKDDEFARNVGVGNTYVITDDPDGLHERAVAARIGILPPAADEDYGSRGFCIRDPEGNLWAFGTYRGSARTSHPHLAPPSTPPTRRRPATCHGKLPPAGHLSLGKPTTSRGQGVEDGSVRSGVPGRCRALPGRRRGWTRARRPARRA